MNNKFILLWLEAPLQSWGADSKFGRRDTLPFPTRSGILGMLLCALGASGEQRELLERMRPLRQTVIAYTGVRKSSDKKNEKKDRDPLLRDFHMVGSGYNELDSWETMLIPKTSEGKKAVSGGTKMTYRFYLQNAKFAVIMETPVELTESFALALQNPVYDIYLGRKNCAPTDIVFRGVFDDETSALNKALEIMEVKGVVEDFRVLDGEHDGDDIMTLNDIPVQFGPVKKYRDRLVTVVWS